MTHRESDIATKRLALSYAGILDPLYDALASFIEIEFRLHSIRTADAIPFINNFNELVQLILNRYAIINHAFEHAKKQLVGLRQRAYQVLDFISFLESIFSMISLEVAGELFWKMCPSS